MGNRKMIRVVGASRRIATGVIVATVAVLLIAVGCDSEPTPSAEVVAAGDIASCRTDGDEATAELVEGIDGTVLALGDEAYPRGTAANFEECYEPSWGRFKGRTKPVPGNHEYYTEGASGYFEYFGDAAGDPEGGYYSYEVGSWHVVALNSNCEEVRCGPGSPRRGGPRRTSLPTTRRGAPSLICTIHASAPGRNMAPLPGVEELWEALYEADADVVFSGHEHNYERFSRRTRRGGQIPRGHPPVRSGHRRRRRRGADLGPYR